MLPRMSNATSPRSRRTLPRIGRVRRGWVYRDPDGRGWWLDDTVTVNGAHRVVPTGHPSAQNRVFTPMVAARETARRVYSFRIGEERGVSLPAVATQLAAAIDDRS